MFILILNKKQKYRNKHFLKFCRMVNAYLGSKEEQQNRKKYLL